MDNSTDKGTEVTFVLAFGLDQQACKDFAINLIDWSARNPGRPIRIDLNCQGGNILDALFLREEFKRLRRVGHHLTIAVFGRSASCAGWLIQVADKRIIGEDSWLLIHEVTSKMEGSLSALKREVARCEVLQQQTIGMLCLRSKLTSELILDRIKDGMDWWLDSGASLEYGLVDEIEKEPSFSS